MHWVDELIHKTPESENKIMENDWRIIMVKIKNKK